MNNADRQAFTDEFSSGLSKREYIVAMAMQGLLASNVEAPTQEFVDRSIRVADAILKALETD